ncbi:MAG: tyrosine protein kinase [Lactobacillales bacterium]|jgi:capsular polysaccharide biosynthesis protein|nr:tyrosine protein kinase [Lactobacillales bacterium]
MEETVSLQEMFAVIKKRFGLIVVTLILGALAAAAVTFFFITPKYGTEAQLVVQSNEQNNGLAGSQSELNTNILMVNTYKDLIQSDVVLDEVASELAKEDGIQHSSGELSSMISVEQSQNSQMFSIKVISTSAKEAMEIANKTATVFKKRAGEVLKVDKVSIISPAKINDRPVSPNNKLNVAIGAVIGLMLGVGIAFLLEFLDKTVKDPRFITDVVGLPILGEVSMLTSRELQNSILTGAPVAVPAKPKPRKQMLEHAHTPVKEKKVEAAPSAAAVRTVKQRTMEPPVKKVQPKMERPPVDTGQLEEHRRRRERV